MAKSKEKLEPPAEEAAQSVSSPGPAPTPPDGAGLQTVSPPAGGADTFDQTRPAVPSLADQLCEVRSRLTCVPKNGSMVIQGNKIEYITTDDLMELVRPLFAQCGIDFRVSSMPDHPPQYVEIKKTYKGNVSTDGFEWILLLRFTYTSAVTGEVVEEFGYGQGRTLAIAQTFAVKYHLLRTLLVGGGDDDEIANYPNEGQQQSKGSRNASPAAQRGNGQAPKTPQKVDRTTLIVKRIHDAMRIHDEGDKAQVVERVAGWIADFPDRLGPVIESGEHAGFPHFKLWTEAQCSFLEQLYRSLDAAAEQEIPF